MLHRALAACRYLLVIPVVGCVLLTAAILVMGFIRIVRAGIRIAEAGDYSATAAKGMSLAVIEIIDIFLIGTVAYITSVGLYKLFISNAEIPLPMRLQIENLKDLEDKIIGVIVAALAVAFLGQAAGSESTEALLNYGGGIALVIAALALFVSTTGKKTDSADKG